MSKPSGSNSAPRSVYENASIAGHLDQTRFAGGERQLSTRLVFGAATIVAALAVTLGCGPRSDRLPVTGKVTLDGAPLDRGSIRLSSMEGQQRMSSGALIQDGQFSIPQDKGLLPGTYRVQITSPDTNAPPVMAPATPSGPAFPVQPDRIPAAYNVNSDKTIEVTSGGDNDFAFDIVGRSTK